MSFSNERPESQKETMELATRVDEVLLQTPASEDVVKMMAKNTREKLILLAQIAQRVENQ
jgi:hypothetical protein